MSTHEDRAQAQAPSLETLGIPLPSDDPDYKLTYENVLQLQDNISGYKPMTEGGYPQTVVFDFAEKLSDMLEIDGSTDLVELVKRHGGRFSYLQYNQLRAEDGSIFVHAPKEFDIVLPIFTSAYRNRFTIAHEFGHYLIHTPNEHSYAQRLGSSRVEWEANWFAAGFLMPTRRFTEAADRYSDNTALLSSLFGVSESAVNIRIKVIRGA